MKTKINIKNLLLFVIANFVSCFGNCLCLKANVGSGAYNALAKCASPVLGIKIGYFQIIQNSLCVLAEYICLKKDFGIRHFLQLFMLTITGVITNFIYYNILADFVINAYALKVVCLIAGDFINAAAVATLLNLDLVTTALGGCCHVISQKLKTKYATIRQSVDVICIVVTLIFVFFFKGELTIREGTIISAFEFGYFVDFFLVRTKKLVDYREDL